LRHLRLTSSRFGVELGCLALILAAAAAVYTRSLHAATAYDEGNYLASLDALRHGQHLGSDVFLDQPPGWYLLLQGVGATFGNTVTGVRTGMLVIALVGLVAAWAAARALGGPLAGLAAAAVLAIAPPYPTLAASVESDPPSTVLALAAIAIALYARRSPWLWAASGAVFALAMSVKLFAVVAALPLAALALRSRRVHEPLLAVAGFAAVVVAFVVGYRHVLHEVWQGVFGAHLEAIGGHQPGAESNLSRVFRVPDLHTPVGWLVVAGIAGALYWFARRKPLGLWPLWLFAVGAAAFTLTMRPLLDHHLVLLATALAVPAGAAAALTLARVRDWALLGLVLFVCAGLYQEHHRLARNDVPERPDYVWAARVVAKETSPDELVVSDVPSIPYLADRREPGQLIDTSIARIINEYLSPAGVLREIERSGARVVVVGRNFRSKPAIIRGLEQRYPRRLRHGEVTVYVRSR
jgi:4-amino-4-deoxy-L-arabinose transferase-like glycosyltransferase